MMSRFLLLIYFAYSMHTISNNWSLLGIEFYIIEFWTGKQVNERFFWNLLRSNENQIWEEDDNEIRLSYPITGKLNVFWNAFVCLKSIFADIFEITNW